ncbi:MAG: acyl-CoA dehydrogenase family protein [Candidatus Latescibacterota bacterium]|nr:MAG: acyl-CoA dehydrogenase family protein [Candidatus Latescibacterota bacterium]
MGNYFTDNDDILFLFEHADLPSASVVMENGFHSSKTIDFAPENAADAMDNYFRILKMLGELAADVIAPTAEATDRIGNRLNPDGSVTYAPGIADALDRLGRADLMGFTLPYEYGGLNCPQLLYVMAIDIVSRADASLAVFFGLQGIADTIERFASKTLKERYLPDLASGRTTAAMVLTEPDAGSDLQSIRLRAYQSENKEWFVHGVKRFITNGCGDVLLVLARSEPGTMDGRGLSLFVVDRSDKVKVRRLDDKLGIHGSPTCELFFDHAPAKLVGKRRRGLTPYVTNLLNKTRVAIAAQSLGIGEAAYRAAREFAHTRGGFGDTIEKIPAVRELLVDMSVDLQAARALTYLAGLHLDYDSAIFRRAVPVERDAAGQKKIAAMLSAMGKYYASEMSVRVANKALAVLGGSGYMRDYPVERHVRDSRITTIYEGTTQIQIVTAYRPVLAGVAKSVIGELTDRDWMGDEAELVDNLREGVGLLDRAADYINGRRDQSYSDLHSRRIVDMACVLIVGALFCRYAEFNDAKMTVAKRWLDTKLPELHLSCDAICSGNRSVLDRFDVLAGRVSHGD